MKYKVGDIVVSASGSSYVGEIIYISKEEDVVRHRCRKTGTEYEKSYFGFQCRYMTVEERLEKDKEFCAENIQLHQQILTMEREHKALTEDRLVAYANAQLGAIARFPKMWGPPYAIEIGYLQLLETLLVTVRPDLDRSHPRFVKEKYREFLGRKYPEAGSSYLSGVFGDDELGPLMTALAEFEGEMRAVLKPQNVFSQYDLALVDAVRERDEARDVVNRCADALRRHVPEMSTRGGPCLPGEVDHALSSLAHFRDEARRERDEARADERNSAT